MYFEFMMGRYDKLDVLALRVMCKENNLRVKGKKSELIRRLEDYEEKQDETFDEGDNEHNIRKMNKRMLELERTIAQLREASVNGAVAPVLSSTPQKIITQHEGMPMPSGLFHNQMTQGPPLSRGEYYQPAVRRGEYYQPAESRGEYYQPSVTRPEYYQPATTDYIPRGATSQPVQGNDCQFANVRDVIDLLPEFDPLKRKFLNSEQFVQRIELLRAAYNWNDKVLLFAVQQKLSGYAKQWLDSQPIVYTSWTHFVSEFTAAFPCVVNVAEIHIEMAKTSRLATETPQEYYYKMVTIGRSGRLCDREIVTHIINGINDMDLRKKISNEYSFCTQLLRDIDVYTTYNEVRQLNVEPVRPFATEKAYNTTNRDVKSNHRDVRCFNCNKLGHYANRCQETKGQYRCGKCNSTNHTTADCPVKRPNVNQIDDSIAVIKKITVNGHVTNAFIDPGSGKSLIRKSFGNKLGEILFCHVVLKGFAGGKYIARQMIQAYIKMDEITITVKMLLVDDDLIAENVLLGTDALCQEGQKLTIENNECHLEPVSTVDMVEYISSQDQQDVDRILANNSKVFANSVAEENDTENEEELSILEKEKETHYHEMEVARKDVLEKQLTQAKIVDESLKSENVTEEHDGIALAFKILYTQNIEIDEAVADEENESETETETNPIIKDIVAELIITTSTESLDNEDKEEPENTEVGNIITEDLFEELFAEANAVQNNRDEDSSIAVSDYFEVKHKFKDKIKRWCSSVPDLDDEADVETIVDNGNFEDEV